jgi:anaerobic selenocysteine-containing dehydrogenase
MKSSLPRRDFLKTALGAAAGGSLLAGCQEGDPYNPTKPSVPGEAGWLTGQEKWISTACAQCPAGCGIRVRVVEARAVKIEGNTACPLNEGGVGPRGLAGPQVLYDPDRLRGPMRRVGARGAASTWEPVAWESAIEELGTRLTGLRDAGRGNRLGIVCGRERGMMLELWQRFARAYGTPNLFDGFSTGNGPAASASALMQGVPEVPAYDWRHARYVLSLGSGMLESSCQAVYFARSQTHVRRGQPGSRAKIVHVGPARTRTALNADQYIPVRPQTYGAFALGIAHILVRDGRHDAEFVEAHTAGFEPWTDEQGRAHRGFRELLEEYSPERVAKFCETSERRLERVAAEIAEARPAFVLGGSEEFRSANGLGAAMAVHALNALLGSIDRQGGVLVQRPAPLAEWPEFELDELAEASLARPALGSAGMPPTPLSRPALDRLPEAILDGGEDPIEALFIYYSNPAYARARSDRWRDALMKVPLIVSFSPVLDETADEFADWILPDHTYLERFEDAAPAPSAGHPIFGIRQPVVEPLGDTRATGDVLIQFAARLGDSVAAALAFDDFKDAVEQRVLGIHAAKRGTIVEERSSRFMKRLYSEGYWSDPEYPYERWEESIQTPSGRFEFFSTTLWRQLEEAATAKGQTIDEYLAGLGVRETPDRVCMPRHDELHWSGDPDVYPLLLLPFRPHTYSEGSGANLPWLQELHTGVGRPTWATEADVHPKTAAESGVSEGDHALITSAHGEIEVLVHTTPDVAPDLLRVPQGGGHTAMGRFATGWGANVMKLVDVDGRDLMSGISPLLGTRVALRRLES